MPNLRNQGVYISQFNIDKAAEKDSWIIRFKDLKPQARERFIKGLKRDSSLQTICQAKEADLLEMTMDLNPILSRPGWQGGFSGSGFFRWKEQILSSALYNSMARHAPRNMNRYSQRELFDTPRDLIVSHYPTFQCGSCGNETPSSRMDYWDLRICNDCASQRRQEEYASRNLRAKS